MLLFNTILILALAAFVGLGLKDGFIYGIGRIFGVVIGFLAARAWYLPASKILFFLPDSWAKILAFIILILLVTRLVGWIFAALDKTYKFLARLPFMKSANSLLGGILGFIEGVAVIGSCVWFIQTFDIPQFLNPYAHGSSVSGWIYGAFSKLLGILL